jgi:3-carboxy-cis,cis-muconate cycloisomerase
MAEELFRPIFVPDKFQGAASGRAWLQAMLEAESALAFAQARAGLIPPDAAEAIASCCKKGRDVGLFDPEELGRKGHAQGNPVLPLVRVLTEAVSEVSEEAARYVHKGATSQDIVDTAAMLLTKRALSLVLAETDAIAAGVAGLTETHRDAPIAAGTVLQQALPTTFGLKAAGWLVSVLEARRRLAEVRATNLAAQLGGAAGTLASLGDSGTEVLKEFARELELAEPVVPWHTDRSRIAEIGGGTLAPCGRAREDLARHHPDGPDRGRGGLRARWRWAWRFLDVASQAKPHPLRDRRR